MVSVTERQNESVDYLNKKSDDEVAYQKFAREMALQVGLKNQSEKVDVLVDALKKSKYYNMV